MVVAVELRIAYHASNGPDRAADGVVEAVLGLQGADGDDRLPLLARIGFRHRVRLVDEAVVDRRGGETLDLREAEASRGRDAPIGQHPLGVVCRFRAVALPAYRITHLDARVGASRGAGRR